MSSTFPGSNQFANMVKIYFETLRHATYSLVAIMYFSLVYVGLSNMTESFINKNKTII